MYIAHWYVLGFSSSRRAPRNISPKVSLYEDMGVSRIKVADGINM
jgi:hypothetical protein